MESDTLRSVRNAYYLGLYSDVAKEVQALDKSNKEAQGQNPNEATPTNVTNGKREEIGTE